MMGSKLSVQAALVNAKWYARSRLWAMSDDDIRYLIVLEREAKNV